MRTQYTLFSHWLFCSAKIGFACILIVSCSSNNNSRPIGSIDLREIGVVDTNFIVSEIARTANTSTIRVKQPKTSPFGESTLVAMAMYQLAKARQFSYFANLQEIKAADDMWVYLVALTDSTNVPNSKQFRHVMPKGVSDRPLIFFSVDQFARLLKKKEQQAEKE